MSPYISLHLPRSPYISRVPAAHELLVRLGDRNVHEDDQDARLRRAGERRGGGGGGGGGGDANQVLARGLS